MAFESMYLEEDIHIDRIYTIHYFEYKSDFHFAGERHNFWEFQCVDKGKAEIETTRYLPSDKRTAHLSQTK